MENPWLTVALAPPLQLPSPVGNLSHSPPRPDPPDPPDPLQFPPLPSPLSGGQKPPKRRSFSPLPLNPTVPSSPPTVASMAPSSGSLPSTTPSAAQLLAAYSPPPPPPFTVHSNPRSESSTVPTNPLLSNPPPCFLSGQGILPPPQSLPSTSHQPPLPSPPAPSHSPTYAEKTKATISRALSRLSPQNFSPAGIPRVIIPDEVYTKGAELHKDFLVCRFFGRVPAFSLIQNVLNFLWGKGKHLEIHMLPQSNSVLVRIQNDFHSREGAAEKILIQLWAHLKGVPFDLMYDAGLSHIAGQLGEPKETDDWTLSLTSISTAHVKVEIDTTIPLPSQVEVGRSNGSFVTVAVEYPWVPPSCAHCKEVAPSSTKFCFSCRTVGHLMNSCPKGPQDWTLVNRNKSPAPPIPSSSHPVIPTSPSPSTQPDPTTQKNTPPSNPVEFQNHITGISSPEVGDAAQPSMDIDTASPSKEMDVVCAESDSPAVETGPHEVAPVLALPAIFKDRPITVPLSPPPLINHSLLSLNPFSAISPASSSPNPSQIPSPQPFPPKIDSFSFQILNPPSPLPPSAPPFSPQSFAVQPDPESSPSGEAQNLS
ncbi:Uncharacterized protein Rs2_45299 [Raphanus sativus]|nr:Uncharacterized protein Rs2_45299 [Raphanus sativus]